MGLTLVIVQHQVGKYKMTSTSPGELAVKVPTESDVPLN